MKEGDHVQINEVINISGKTFHNPTGIINSVKNGYAIVEIDKNIGSTSHHFHFERYMVDISKLKKI